MSYIAEIPYVGWVLPFLIVLGVVVFVHEFGHYIVGRWCGIRAEVFSIGFGPELTHWIDRRGMRWRVGAVPLGGYVKFVGDMNAASAGMDKKAIAALSPEERRGAFHLAPLWARTLTVLAGPVFNFILSILVYAALAMASGKDLNEPVIGAIREDANPDLGLQAGDRVIAINGKHVETFTELLEELAEVEGERATALVDRGAGEQEVEIRYVNPARIDRVIPGGAAADAGMKAGDVVIEANGAPIRSFEDLRKAVIASEGDPIGLKVRRGDDIVELAMTPQMVERPTEDGGVEMRPMIGVTNDSFGGIEPVFQRAYPYEALQYGAVRTVGIIATTLGYLSDVIFGDADASALGGPIQIAKVSGQAAEQGFESLVSMIALISTSIGLINLFPIPVLDGGHLVFYALEAVRGKPIKERWQEIGNGLGFALILLLMVFATYNDLLR